MEGGPSIFLLTLQENRGLSILQVKEMRLRYYRLAPIHLPPKTSAQRENKHSPGKHKLEYFVLIKRNLAARPETGHRVNKTADVSKGTHGTGLLS